MGIDKDGSKGGGYVGGFFHLFDWKAKSRKKLFSSKSDLPEHAKQGKKSDGNLPTTRVYLMDEDESGLWSNARGNSDYSCASSVTDEEGCGSRGPSVVARLMGLDSMPTSYSEPYATPFFDTQSLRDAQFQRRRNLEYSQNYQAMYSGDLINKTEEPVRNHVESKPQRILNRPIEKFQSEIFPPKSAKTIPITQHKLLSPIKCPGFVPSRNAAHIMEAAARIIEPAPQSTLKGKLPFQGSTSGHLKVGDLRGKEEIPEKVSISGPSSVSLRVRDLKEKVEATRKASRPTEPYRRLTDSDSSAVRYLRGQSLSKSYNGAGTSSFRSSPENEETSSAIKNNNGKSISLAIQAKVNVQKREGLNSSERNAVFHPEQVEGKFSQPFRSQSRPHKNTHKKSASPNASGALRQNNQKQNCSMDKEKLPSKSMVSSSRKSLPADSSIRAKSLSKSAGSTKAGSRKLDVLDGDKEISQANMKNFPRKKRSIDGGFQFEKNKISNDLLSDRNKKQVQSNSVIQKNWIEDSRKKGMDVVSFTFTAPLSQKSHGSSLEQWGKGVLSEADSMKLSSLGYNVIGGDALSKLLEQKLRELTYEVSSSCQASASVDSISTAASAFQEPGVTPDTVSSKPRLHVKRDHDLLLENKFGAQNHTDWFANNPPLRRLKHDSQGTDDTEEHVIDGKKLLDSRHPSPVSVLEPSFASESCMSLESTESNWIEGNKQATTQAAEIFGAGFSIKSHSVEADMDLSDSASSLSTGGTLTRKHGTANTSSDILKSINWELEYVKEILCDVELMYKEFTLGQACSIVSPHLFEQLEDRKGFMDTDDGDSRVRRKVLFNCVSELMELRFRRYVGGGYEAWEMGLAMARRKDRLAEDVYREISGWRGLADSMVDDLVDRDMSGPYGKWLDFEVEGFELGVEIEGEILNSLLDEVIAGICRL